MRRGIAVFPIILMISAGFEGCTKADTNHLITVDVTKSFPEKELILQDFMDVEYIPLETNNDFVTQGVVMAMGNKFMIIKNWSNDGDVFVFDRKTGQALRKINRKGKGSEEYIHLTDIVVDEINNELFVSCMSSKKILVYDLLGNFKRSFNHAEGTRYVDVFNCDANHLICYNESTLYKDGEKRGSEPHHMIVSKHDGRIARNITIPFDVINTPLINEGEMTVSIAVSPIIPYHDAWLLVETSSDTVYNYSPKDDKLTPFLVKSPTANPVIFLTMGTITDRYCFITTVTKEFDFTARRGFLMKNLMYDKQENAMFEPTVINGDFVKRKTVDLNSHPLNGEIAVFQILEAYQLVDAYKKDELKGKLKEVAAGLHESSNPVIMVMRSRRK